MKIDLRKTNINSHGSLKIYLASNIEILENTWNCYRIIFNHIEY